MVIDRSSRQATLFCGIASVGEIRIDLEIVVLVPRSWKSWSTSSTRFGSAWLMANDARPSGRIDDEKVRSAGFVRAAASSKAARKRP